MRDHSAGTARRRLGVAGEAVLQLKPLMHMSGTGCMHTLNWLVLLDLPTKALCQARRCPPVQHCSAAAVPPAESTVGGCACRASLPPSSHSTRLQTPLSQAFLLKGRAAIVHTPNQAALLPLRVLYVRGRYEAVEREADALRQPYQGLARLLNCDAEEVAILQSATAALDAGAPLPAPQHLTPLPTTALPSAAGFCTASWTRCCLCPHTLLHPARRLVHACLQAEGLWALMMLAHV